jgi:hypothetical protein
VGGEGFNFNFICLLSEAELSSLLVSVGVSVSESVRLLFGNKKIIVLQVTVEKYEEI